MNRNEPGSRALFIGRYFQIAFYLHYSWFLIAGLVTFTLGREVFPQAQPLLSHSTHLWMGFTGALLFFFSILLHEMGHSLVSQRCGIPVPRITLMFIGGVAEISREPDDAISELKIALGGPAVSAVLVALYAGLWALFGWLGWSPAGSICAWLAVANSFLIIFNMIPGYPLDGGRVLRALLWARSGKLRQSTYITSRIGIGFSWLLVAWGAWGVFKEHQWTAVTFFIIAIFLKSAAESGYHNALQRELLAGITVRDIMTADPVWIADFMPLNRVVDEVFLTNHHVAFPVCSEGKIFCGLILLESLKTVPPEKWPYTSAGELVAGQSSERLSIRAGDSAARAMRELLSPGTERLAVIEGGRLVGMVSRHDILHVIKIHTALE